MTTIYEQERIAKIDKIKALGVDPYGHRITDIDSIRVVRVLGEKSVPTTPVTVAGRIVLLRPSGGITFLQLRDEDDDIQVAIRRNEVDANTWELQKLFDLGDLIAVRGLVSPSKTGELTVWANNIQYGAKALFPPPDKHEGLTDVETRLRRRYVDLYSDPQIMRTFQKRSVIIKYIRTFLDKEGYMEVETPMMQSVPGGASAKPFITHHNALDIDLYLRIAPELYLKRLLVAGMNQIFEIGRNFRNEGISPRHNPEFTVLEAYSAYGDYEEMMFLAESMIKYVAKSIGNERFSDPLKAFRRVNMMDLVREHIGENAPTDPLKAHKLYEQEIEHTLMEPTFVLHLPKEIVPLAKESSKFPGMAACFELIMNGQEIGPGYTELNDPTIQEQRLLQQVGEDPDRLDVDFIRALKHGMPPAGGIGIGIDRLCMVLLDVSSVKDVILFPTLKPE